MNSIRYLNSEELQSFKKEARKSKLHDLAFDLCLTYALRVKELVSLKLEDFDFENGEIYIEGVKGGKKKHHPLSGKMEQKYRAWLRVRKKMKRAKSNPYLFPSRVYWGEPGSRDYFQSAFKQICGKANINGHSIHDLRHTCAINLIKAGQPVIDVRDWLRQRQVSSTEVYVRYLDGKEASKKNLEILSSLL